MKSLSMATCVALLPGTACTKVITVTPTLAAYRAIETTQVLGVENLGSPLKGTNVSWLNNPLYPNLKPLITIVPNSTLDYVAVMIDSDRDENTKPSNLVFVEATPGKYDLYISGLKSLYRASTC